MLRMTALLIVEAFTFAILATLLFRDPSVLTTRIVAWVLVAITAFATIMIFGQRVLLEPFAKRVGICELCTKKNQ